ncbi:MAG: hypothetical protein ACKO96_43175, partial [Flammeovirgaceae bacterium]
PQNPKTPWIMLEYFIIIILIANNMRRVPAILTDIDGVIYRGRKIIGNSRDVLDTLLKPVKN